MDLIKLFNENAIAFMATTDSAADPVKGWFSFLGSNAAMFETLFRVVMWGLFAASVIGGAVMFGVSAMSNVANKESGKRVENYKHQKAILIACFTTGAVTLIIGTVFELTGKMTGISDPGTAKPAAMIIDYVVQLMK